MLGGENDLISGIPITPLSSSSSPPSTAVTEPPVATVDEEEGVGSESFGPNGIAGMKPAWNKPSSDSKVGTVMGTNKWPALSESAKGPSKSSSDSPRASLDGSSSSPSGVPVSQGSGQKSVSNIANPNPNLTPNHTTLARQKSMKHYNNISASNGGLSLPPPQGPVAESHVNSPSSWDHIERSGFVSQSHTGGNDHQHQRNSYRHRNGGLHPRGDGSHHQNFGGRRNQDHGNHEWHGRNLNSRDGHLQPRGAPRVMRHPPPSPVPNSIPFIAHTPMQPFGTPMGYPGEMPSLYMVPGAPPDSLAGLSFVPPMPPVFFPAPELHDNQLFASIVNQIDYYFSNENLIKDTYLRQNMDEQGWVPIKLIAGFKKVSLLTDNIQLIMDALQSSTVVEVQGDRIRKRNDWMRWIMPPSVQFPAISGQDMLVARVQNISLEQRNANQSGVKSQKDSNAGGLSGRPLFGDFSNQPQQFNSEGTAIGVQSGPANN
ncbi:putative Basic-leucine zipper transcription factor family protein [Hibiscus syriacus]|uniref:Basic-leucine zipper transcription factor family protein n=1 Tax=Hibiscus syriacus TaxID=106335 RepID=A0A6A3BIR7_HIBSY|nr:la-related protein 1C-like isoform X3 [Hibiscus syriacus]KAE8715917.1 putative Basic-leucine zipper transcription factor family protein [Hibiscus syriacus]